MSATNNRSSRRVLPPWTWPALDRLDQRVSTIESEVADARHLLSEMNHTITVMNHTVTELNRSLQQMADMVSTTNHRAALLEEISHVAKHLDDRFIQVRNQVEIVSALSLSLQRQAERQGMLPPEPPGP
jgi:methyl-accepting chemotaxis protein